MVALLAAAIVPIPIGVGPRYHPPSASHGACVARPLRGAGRVHVELFAHRRVVLVPAAVGLHGAAIRFGRVTGARCSAKLWTTDASGVVHFASSARLGELFRVWGRPLRPRRLLGFDGRVRLYRNGVRVGGDPRRLVLRDGDELVLEVGAYVPPHRTYRFAS